MLNLTIAQLAEIIAAEIGAGCNPEAVTNSVTIDSREVSDCSCFFAIKGLNHDGHDFIGQVIDSGAACVVAAKDRRHPNQTGNILYVDDTIEAMGKLAQHHRLNNLDATAIAITGSVGKTSTRQIVAEILSTRFRTHQSPKSFNNNIGLPLTILSAPAETEILILELGTNHPGEIEYLTKIACPDIALVNNVYPAHLEGFGSLEKIIEEKISIYKGLRGDKPLIINADIPNLASYCHGSGIRFRTFGISPHYDFSASGLHCHAHAGSMKIEGRTISVPLAGKGNLYNTLAAWAICSSVGMDIDSFAEATGSLTSPDMRMQLEHIGEMTIIADCYNANPASMHNAIESLTTMAKPGQRKVFICGHMGELGGHSEPAHKQLGDWIAQAKIDVLATGGPFAETTAEAALHHPHSQTQTHCFASTEILCDNLHEIVKADDIILVKGSRAAGLEKAIERLRALFS